MNYINVGLELKSTHIYEMPEFILTCRHRHFDVFQIQNFANLKIDVLYKQNLIVG